MASAGTRRVVSIKSLLRPSSSHTASAPETRESFCTAFARCVPGVPAGPRSGRVTGCRIGAPRQSAALFSPFAGAPFQILLQPFDQRVDRDMPQEPQLQTTWTAFLDRLRSEIPD